MRESSFWATVFIPVRAMGMLARMGLINDRRLWERHEAMARIGATGRGGVCRLALTPEDTAGRALLLSWASRLGFAASLDPIGNLFLRREGRSTHSGQRN